MAYEQTALSSVGRDELDQAALERFLSMRAPELVAEIGLWDAATRFGLVAKAGSRVHPTPVGLLCFGRAPQRSHPQWGVSALRLEGSSLASAVGESADIEGPIAELVEKSEAFVAANSRAVVDAAKDDQAGEPPTREETRKVREYPSDAVREALVNALVHRDLRKPGRVSLRLFDDRLEIWSPGGPADALSQLDALSFEGGVSLPRNPLLAATARLLGYGQQVGRGLLCIRRAFYREVEIRCSSHDVLVVLPSRLMRPAAAIRLS